MYICIYAGALLSIYSTPPFKIHPTAMLYDVFSVNEQVPFQLCGKRKSEFFPSGHLPAQS